MSKLTDALGSIDPATVERPQHGPRNVCGPVYGPGSLEDWRAVEDLRHRSSWTFAQQQVDAALGITDPLPPDKFRYHWLRHCSCWPREHRRA